MSMIFLKFMSFVVVLNFCSIWLWSYRLFCSCN